MATKAPVTWTLPVPELGEGPPVLVFDPGERTGYAFLVPHFTGTWTLLAGEAQSDAALVYARDVLALYDAHRPVVVSEAFTITASTAKKTAQPWSLESIGVLRFLARRHGCPFETQMVGDAKRFTTDARLKALGWHRSTKGGHVNDALRHLYLWLVNQRRYLPPDGVV